MPHSRLLAGIGTDSLSLGEQLLLWSLRSWDEAVRQRRCPLCAIQEPFALIKAEPVAEALHRSFVLLLRPRSRPLDLHPPRAGVVGEDESRFLLAAGAAFHGGEALACRLLTGLLPRDLAAALATALGALGELLARHGLSVPERLPAVTRLAMPTGDLQANAGLSLVH